MKGSEISEKDPGYKGTVNFVQVETKTGIKEFELYHGDITDLSFNVDLLTISSIKDDYLPTPRSVIGQLFQKGRNVEKLAFNPLLDFKDSLGTWVSANLDKSKMNNIICLEITGKNGNFQNAVRNLFSTVSTMEIQGIKSEKMALSLWATGDQSLDINDVIPVIIESSLDFLRYSRYLSKVYFVIRNREKVMVFNDAMNRLLGREKLNTPNSELSNIIKRDLINNLNLLIDKDENPQVFKDFLRLIKMNFEAFEFGAIARKTIEYIMMRLEPDSKNHFELIKKIDSLGSQKVALWIQSYLHLIRIFGNEAVHSKETKDRMPQYVEMKDLEIGMYCMNRILEFYINKSSFSV